MALGVAALLMVAPFIWSGPAWANALVRILNPFSARQPVTVAHLYSVTPGNGASVTGQPLTISVTASGRAGQEVSMNLWPGDDDPSTVQLGTLTGHGPQSFSYTVSKVNADLDYRVRAGDAVSSRFRIFAVSPLSYSGVDIIVTPPKGFPADIQHLNGLTDQIVAPAGSQLALTVKANRPLNQCEITLAGAPGIRLATADSGKSFTGAATLVNEGLLHVASATASGETADAAIRAQLATDLPPGIRILSPEGRGILGPGAVPVIQFEATDDFALTRIDIEQGDPGKVIKEWTPTGQRTLTASWIGDAYRPMEGQTATFRVVAYDNYAGETPHRTVSPPILFQLANPKDLSAAAAKFAAETQAALDKLVALQTQNLARTKGFVGRDPGADQWSAALDTQKQIRDLTGTLINDPRKPLASRQQKVEPLYTHEMLEAVTLLEAEHSAPNLAQAIANEEIILHILTGVDTAFAQGGSGPAHRRRAGLDGRSRPRPVTA